MSRDCRVEAAEAAQATAGIEAGGLADQPEEHEKDDSNGQERKEADLELARSASAPLYSVFSRKQKFFIVFMASFAGFFSPVSATIYLPALNPISADLGVSIAAVTLTITTYMIFQGISPMFMGDLSDMSGRRPVYLLGFIIYIGACIGIALQDSFAALLILRCVQSSGSACTVALGSGVAADVSTSAERGVYMGWVTSGMLLAPAIGPIVGGILAEFLGWRSIFWFLVILAGAFLVPFVIFFPETGRNVVGNGSIPPQTFNMSVMNYLEARKASRTNELERTTSSQSLRSARDEMAKHRKLQWPNPLKTLKVLLEKDIALLLFYNCLVFTSFYQLTAAQSYLFKRIYNFNELQIGLSFIPFGVGSFLAPLIIGRIQDWNFRRVANKAGITVDKKRGNALKDFPLEVARLPVAFPPVLMGVLCLILYGWIMHIETNLAAPLVLQFILGISLTGSSNVISVMLVDNYPTKPATAVAANNLCRCLMGAGGTAVIIYMIDAMGVGWCFTFIGLVVLAATPILLVLLKYGPGWRRERLVREQEMANAATNTI